MLTPHPRRGGEPALLSRQEARDHDQLEQAAGIRLRGVPESLADARKQQEGDRKIRPEPVIRVQAPCQPVHPSRPFIGIHHERRPAAGL
jgi:hypothetical protein